MVRAKLTGSLVFIFAAVSVITFLSGCGSDDPKNITDEQIIELLGTRSFPKVLADAPLTISKAIDDCLGTLSGIDGKKMDDVPVDMEIQLKNSCTTQLKDILKDPAKNKFGITIEVLKNPDFAWRVRKVKQDADKRVEVYTDMIYQVVAKTQLEKEKFAREKATENLARYKADYVNFLSTLEDSYNKILALCDDWSDYALQIQRNSALKPTFNFQRSSVCDMSFAYMQQVGEFNVKKNDDLKIERRGMDWYFDKGLTDEAPITPNWFEKQTKELNTSIEAMRSLLGNK